MTPLAYTVRECPKCQRITSWPLTEFSIHDSDALQYRCRCGAVTEFLCIRPGYEVDNGCVL